LVSLLGFLKTLSFEMGNDFLVLYVQLLLSQFYYLIYLFFNPALHLLYK
jgi:hypothetical protein